MRNRDRSGCGQGRQIRGAARSLAAVEDRTLCFVSLKIHRYKVSSSPSGGGGLFVSFGA